MGKSEEAGRAVVDKGDSHLYWLQNDAGADKYQDLPGKTSCKTCQGNGGSVIDGGAACECAAGWFKVYDNVCDQCAPGRYGAGGVDATCAPTDKPTPSPSSRPSAWPSKSPTTTAMCTAGPGRPHSRQGSVHCTAQRTSIKRWP